MVEHVIHVKLPSSSATDNIIIYVGNIFGWLSREIYLH